MTRAGIAVALALACLGAPAQAAMTICNRTSTVLYAATAAVAAGKTQAQGWTRIVPGDCQVARNETLTASSYLVHARSSLAHSGPARAWGGKVPVCVKDTDFHFAPAAAAACKEEGAFTLPFAPIARGNHGNWTMTLDETPALPSLMAAQLAGVKRLLHDNGYDVGPLDGAPNRKTGAALAAFRKQAKLSDKAGNAELFSALERNALKTNAPSGYTICNDGKALLEAALAQTGDGKSLAHGWWTVPPGACARALTTPLAQQTYYLYARRKDGVAVVAGGEKFCIAATAFETGTRGDCAARGQAEAGFLRTQTNGLPGYVARIGDKGLAPGGAPGLKR
jgi:uncharacterized membrane protein